MAEEPRCEGTNKEGDPCSATPQPGRRFCVWHDPDRAAERAEWRRSGGRNRSNAAKARREIEQTGAGVRNLPGVLYRALRKVEAGELEPNVATAMATLGRAIVAATQAAELEERLAALESRAGIGRGAA